MPTDWAVSANTDDGFNSTTNFFTVLQSCHVSWLHAKEMTTELFLRIPKSSFCSCTQETVVA